MSCVAYAESENSCAGFLKANPLSGEMLTGVVYGELLQACPGFSEVNGRLKSLGVSNMSNFPYVTRHRGHTIVFFNQLKTGVHGEGSIPMVAIRRFKETQWSWYSLRDLESKVEKLDPDLAQTFKEMNLARHRPLPLRNFIVSRGDPPRLSRMDRPNGFAMFSSAMYDPIDRMYFRTGYKDGKTWLFQATSLIEQDWDFRRLKADGAKCSPVASHPGYNFSEAVVARVRDNHWVAVIREDSGIDQAGRNTRRLFQTESKDNGCTWGTPARIGDGTQPHFLKRKLSETDERLVLCVGDRIPFGVTPEVGIYCRLSRNLLDAPGVPVHWGQPRMIHTIPSGKGSDVGQPNTVYLGEGVLETYFYADPDSTSSGAGTEIFYVRHLLSDLDRP